MASAETPDSGKAVLIVGASGGIGSALVRHYLDGDGSLQVYAVSRAAAGPDELVADSRVHWLQCDHSEESIKQVVVELVAGGLQVHRVVICTGVLHGDDFMPEKALDAINGDVMRAVLDINLVVPALWVAALARPLRRASDTVIGVLSARVGSIGDNQLGGWYSYRSSKAALNMFLKSAAIEYARRAPGVKLVAFHPGTTDTELSRPFQANVPAGKLFTTEFVAERLLTLLDDLEPDGELSYLDWAGSDIPW